MNEPTATMELDGASEAASVLGEMRQAYYLGLGTITEQEDDGEMFIAVMFDTAPYFEGGDEDREKITLLFSLNNFKHFAMQFGMDLLGADVLNV